MDSITSQHDLEVAARCSKDKSVKKLNFTLVRTLKVGRYMKCGSDRVRSTTTLRYWPRSRTRVCLDVCLNVAKSSITRGDACDILQPPTTPCFFFLPFSSNSSHASRDLLDCTALESMCFCSIMQWQTVRLKLRCDARRLCERKSIVKYQQLVIIRCTLSAGVSRYAQTIKNKMHKSQNN